MKNNVKSDFLFAQPSFVTGVARLLDLYGTFDQYNMSSTVVEADHKAIAADWFCVGQDMQVALEQYEAQQEL